MISPNSPNNNAIEPLFIFSPELSDAIFRVLTRPGRAPVQKEASDLLGRLVLPDADIVAVDKLLRALRTAADEGGKATRSSLREAWKDYESLRSLRARDAALRVLDAVDEFLEIQGPTAEQGASAARSIVEYLADFRDPRSRIDAAHFSEFVQGGEGFPLDAFKNLCEHAREDWQATIALLRGAGNPADTFNSEPPSATHPALNIYAGLVPADPRRRVITPAPPASTDRGGLEL